LGVKVTTPSRVIPDPIERASPVTVTVWQVRSTVPDVGETVRSAEDDDAAQVNGRSPVLHNSAGKENVLGGAATKLMA
jgi:hypothetical protein